jgi:transglutaminase-like putative cysteine protease
MTGTAANETSVRQASAVHRVPIAPLGSPFPPGAVPLTEAFPPAVAMNRGTLKVIQLTNYRYAVPASHVETELRLVPPPEHGWQKLLEHNIQVAPLPHAMPRRRDRFSNEIVEAHHEKVNTHLTFAVELVVETCCMFTDAGFPLPSPIPPYPGETPDMYREMTWRTLPDIALEETARALEVQSDVDRDPLRFFAALCDRVHREMVFASGSTGVETPATVAWGNRRGVCQDYTHITLTLCRLCGIPARYVSGFVPGEGVMHAWVEALLPLRRATGDALYWFAYDPTYNKWVDDNYVTVAVGRDYADITPTSGIYYGGESTVSYRNRVTRQSRDIILL